MDSGLRRTGIDAVGQVPWGTHFCQFYRDRADLLDVLVPYFKAGLEDNEACIWVTSDPLDASYARKSLAKAVPRLSDCLTREQIEIIPHTEWYLEDGSFDQHRVLDRWLEKLNAALARGYSGLRASGDLSWLGSDDWQRFSEYEAAVNQIIGRGSMIALCTYSLDRCSAAEIVDVVCNHEFALLRRNGRWEPLESAFYRRTREALADESRERYRSLFENVPIALHEEDWSDVKRYLDSLRSRETGDFRERLASNPAIVAVCAKKVRIVDVNQAALRLYEAGTKRPILSGRSRIFGEEGHSVLAEELAALVDGKRFEGERPINTVRGNVKHVYLTLSVAPGCEDTWARVLLSFTDITRRKETERELRSSREYLEKLNNALHDVLFTVKFPDRVVIYVNDSVRNVFGYEPEECIGRSTLLFHTSKQAYARFGDAIRNAIVEGNRVYGVECLMRRKNGEVFPAEVTSTFVREDDGATQVISILRDVTERRQADEQMRLSEGRLAEAQRIAHLGNWDWNIVKNELVWSDEIYNIFGLTPQQFGATYDAFLEAVHMEDRKFVSNAVDSALYERKPYSIDHRILLPEGSVRFVHEQAEVTYDDHGRPVRMVGTVQDITERTLAERQLRDLSHRLLRAHEEERRSLARELHDEVGQALTTLKISLARIQKSGDCASTELEQAQGVLADLVGRVRNLSLSLSPSMLSDVGLLATLQWYLKSYTAMTGTKVRFKHSGLHRPMPQEISLAAYRVIQEALTNVARHAGTGEVMICIRGEPKILRVEIEDHGVGFDASAFDKPATGIMGMKERVATLQGRFEVSSSPGVGTYLLIEFPLPPLSKGRSQRRRKGTERSDKAGSGR